jgi:hypothetical protein
LHVSYISICNVQYCRYTYMCVSVCVCVIYITIGAGCTCGRWGGHVNCTWNLNMKSTWDMEFDTCIWNMEYDLYMGYVIQEVRTHTHTVQRPTQRVCAQDDARASFVARPLALLSCPLFPRYESCLSLSLSPRYESRTGGFSTGIGC